MEVGMVIVSLRGLTKNVWVGFLQFHFVQIFFGRERTGPVLTRLNQVLYKITGMLRPTIWPPLEYRAERCQ